MSCSCLQDDNDDGELVKSDEEESKSVVKKEMVICYQF